MQIGYHSLSNNVFVAPMAGVTDRPFRQLCRAFGAGYAVSEMVTSRKDLWQSLKTSRRANHDGEPGPIAVQIAGTDAAMMAEAAVYNIDRGAQIIDINMGCPAKKVCNKWAGSALMQDEPLALSIIDAVVQAGAEEVQRVSFSSSHYDALRLEALALAVENARRDAGIMAKAAGGRLGQLIEVSVSQPSLRDHPQIEAMAMRAAPSPVPTEIAPAEQDIVVTVNSRWRFILTASR